MIDRLLALVLTLTLAVGAIVEPPCCCKSPTGVCRVEAQNDSARVEPSSATTPNCCKVAQELPLCCQQKAAGVESGPCKCDGCLTNRPDNPLHESAAAPRAPAFGDLPLALGAGPLDPPHVVSLGESRWTGLEGLSLDRPPPDRQALLCVWVI